MQKLLILSIVMVAGAGTAAADTFNIEIDYMVGTHTHKPTTAMLDAVKQAFACQGHTLNINLDDAIPHVNVLVRNPNSCNSSLFSYDNNTYSSFGQIRQDYFDHAGISGWVYGVFAHQYQDTSCATSGSSGLSDGGLYFIVTMGSFSGGVGTAFDNASTLMHEFGHNLGLSHCGTQVCGSNTADPNYVGPYVPNMPSTMSYDYQLAGVETNMLCQGISIPDSLFKNIDYSHGRMCSVNENNLDERFGSGMTELDWDCDGVIESSVVQDITDRGSWCGATGNRTSVSDYNEWANLSPGAALVTASETGDYRDLIKADYQFVDPTDTELVKASAARLLLENKRPELRSTLIEARTTGDVSWLPRAKILSFDPQDTEAVKRFATRELEERRTRMDEQPCVSSEQWEEVRTMRLGGCSQPALATEACLAGNNAYVGTLFCIPLPAICFDFGTCPFPHGSVQNAHALQPARSTFYLKPGTYDEAGITEFNKRGIWTCERNDTGGSAVIR